MAVAVLSAESLDIQASRGYLQSCRQVKPPCGICVLCLRPPSMTFQGTTRTRPPQESRSVRSASRSHRTWVKIVTVDVTLENPDPLWVDLIDPDVIDVQWRVDENLVADATGESFRPSDYGSGPGNYTITARAFDPTDWVRVGLDSLEQIVSWNVELTSPLVTPGDMDGDGDIDFDDIDDFVLGVTNAGLYEDTFGVPPSMRGDTDGDDDMDFDDIPGFVAMMPGLPRDNWLYVIPEPTTLFLAAISLLVALGWPRQRVRETWQTDRVCKRKP
jgi:hypothetical protein